MMDHFQTLLAMSTYCRCPCATAVAGAIGHLNTAARAMRRRRFDNGALRLDQSKLIFRLDDDGNPAMAAAYITRESNHLAGPLKYSFLSAQLPACHRVTVTEKPLKLSL